MSSAEAKDADSGLTLNNGDRLSDRPAVEHYVVPTAWPELSKADAAALRAVVVPQLLTLKDAGELTSAHIMAVAQVFGKTDHTIRNWIAARAPARKPRTRLQIDEELRLRLAGYRGNVARLYKDLVAEAKREGRRPPGRSTVYRAVSTDLNDGYREGIKKGARASRKYDVYLRRPKVCRNAVWEADHVQADVEVDVDGELRKPWLTWFTDTFTNAIVGMAVTAQNPSRGSVLVALRAAISRTGSFGPFGGLPGLVRIDRGKEFVADCVASAMAVFAVPVQVLPAYQSFGKGHIEQRNKSVKEQLFSDLPRYTHAPRLINNKVADPDAPPLRYSAFVAHVLGWVDDWNTVWTKPGLGDRTPLQAWEDDPTPLREVSDKDLALFTMEDDGSEHPIDKNGVRFDGLDYVGDFMNGSHTKVRIRYIPNHPELIECFDIRTGKHLGSAFPSNQASREQVKDVVRTRARAARQLEKDLKEVERQRRIKYASDTTAAPPRIVSTLSAEQAERELDRARDDAESDGPDLFPAHRPPSSRWVLPQATTSDDDPQ